MTQEIEKQHLIKIHYSRLLIKENLVYKNIDKNDVFL
jgi:hypothetical protein